VRYLVSRLLFMPLVLLLLSNNGHGAYYVGAEECAGCHQPEMVQWSGSHHDWAMKVATAETVLGNFDNVTFSHQGILSTFTRNDGAYYVRTQGANGKYQTFKIDYTFGVEPLQQYLIKFEDGRMQALTTAWDSRPEQQGGQRWYQLMPDDMGAPGESLHWTGAYYNWNSRCAECHSTGLEQNYSMATDTYATTWSEANVACESCHGPGSEHSKWAKSGKQGDHNGLQVQYSQKLNWVIAEGASVANPLGDPHSGATTEIESCAACHARRSKISSAPINNYSGDKSFLDHYQLQTLGQGLYHADGQIEDEVYVYGSYLQSKMYQRGVSCSNCHNPHSLELKAEGNELCSGCHAPQTYDTPRHHHHQQADSAGAQCVNCHMPATVYMGVDARRDHSMRVPRPDVTAQIGAPNACNMCHTDRAPQWSISAIESWLGKNVAKPELVAQAIFAGRTAAPDANQLLIDLANDATVNDMARATALGLLANHPNAISYGAIQQQLKSDKPLLRIGALSALEFLPLQQRWQDVSPLLNDPVRSVRFAATKLLIGIGDLNSPQQAELDGHVESYIAALMVNADMPNGQLNLALAYLAQGSMVKAEQAYGHALKLDPKSIPAMLNLADLYRIQGRQDQALSQLLRAQALSANNATVLFSLGLAQIRSKQLANAMISLKKASTLAPEVTRYSYVYGVALNAQGRSQEAIKVMIDALARDSQNRDLLFALATINRDLGRLEDARGFAQRLVVAFPQDRAALQLHDSLKY